MEENQRFEAELDIPADQLEKKNKKKNKPRKEGIAYELLDLLKTFIVCSILVFLFTRFIMQPVQVDGISMYPTLEDKQIGLMNIIDKKIHGVKRFDVVVVNDEKITGGDNWVKRVIGVPGDSVYVRDDVVYVNGQAIDQSFLNKEYVEKYCRESGKPFTENFDKVTLNDDEYWLMGDNRPVSHDSRAVGVGPFSIKDFKGKDIYVIYPFTDMKLVRNGKL